MARCSVAKMAGSVYHQPSSEAGKVSWSVSPAIASRSPDGGRSQQPRRVLDLGGGCEPERLQRAADVDRQVAALVLVQPAADDHLAVEARAVDRGPQLAADRQRGAVVGAEDDHVG